MRKFFRKVFLKLKGWRTAIFAFLAQVAVVLDASDILIFLPEKYRTEAFMGIVIIGFLFLRHITETRAGWRKGESDERQY